MRSSASCAFSIVLATWATLSGAGLLYASADEDWQSIIEAEAGPQVEVKSRKEAQHMSLAHLGKQEQALRGFFSRYPDDPRAIDARIRLSHLLATRSDLMGTDAGYEEAVRMLEKLAKDRVLPRERQADIAFARIVVAMRRARNPNARQREDLLARGQNFEKAFPQDRRVAALLTEMATLCDADPKRKEALLRSALPRARSEELKSRIQDDLRRLALLGKPVEWEFTSAQGERVSLASYRTKVVLIYFFADWSPPSQVGLAEIKYLAAQGGERMGVIGVTLDESPGAALASLKEHGVDWPVYCDGKGWESELLRGWGINALPTLWIFDRAGNLRALNASNDGATVVKRLLAEGGKGPGGD